MPTSTALVTGASRGLGRAVALALGAAGWRVGICSRSGDGVSRTLAALREGGVRAAGRPADVANEADVNSLVALVERELGPIDTLVNNAGVLCAKPFQEITPDEWDESFATNVRGLYLVTRAVLPGMRTRRRGTIVNVASLSARGGWVGGTAYTASKHAVLGFSRSLMLEVRDEGVRVITVCPGSIDTEMIQRQDAFESDPARILKAEDVAQTILHAIQLPPRALVSELDIRPAAP
jgi:3-oxoacyl-[acyl-carrier protein] reductase